MGDLEVTNSYSTSLLNGKLLIVTFYDVVKIENIHFTTIFDTG